ncbi:quinone oxidoreductase [uncultured Sphingomonas sp.]|uniref:quinone oxidoreductase family protein n=1 Tax=uncultured Sphingomonas sp. TaxID=158754 RepID=UPI0035CB3941
MARAAVIERTGGPEVIGWRDVALPPPGPGEVRVRHAAVGLNYIDTYFRSGLYPVTLPSGLGAEAAGVIEAAGEGVDLPVGARVGTWGPALGAYATARNVAAEALVRLPDDVEDETAAAILLKGATAAFLVEDCARVQADQTVLVWSAAGGVGHLLVGWLKAIGATVIGVVGTAAKADAVLAAGADHVLRHDADDVAARVRELTGGVGAPVVLDGVGAATWEVSLKSAARRGLIVSYGNAGGAVEGVNLGVLARHGSLFVTRPTLFDYAVTPADRQRLADRVFAMLRQGAIRPEIGQRWPLEQAADAHRALEAGKTRGSTVLLP